LDFLQSSEAFTATQADYNKLVTKFPSDKLQAPIDFTPKTVAETTTLLATAASNYIDVADTFDNLASQLASYAAETKIKTISITNFTTPTAAQMANITSAISKIIHITTSSSVSPTLAFNDYKTLKDVMITSTAKLNVTGVLSNNMALFQDANVGSIVVGSTLQPDSTVQNNLSTLEACVSKITSVFPQSRIEMVVSDDTLLESKFPNASIIIVDNLDNLTTDKLTTLIASGKVFSIKIGVHNCTPFRRRRWRQRSLGCCRSLRFCNFKKYS
jgi:hypothetical protein